MPKAFPLIHTIIFLLILLLHTTVTKGQSAQKSADHYYAITNTTLIDGAEEGEMVLENQTVVIKNDIIVRIGPSDSVDIPGNATLIDGKNNFLVPGLADMHVHLERFNDPVVLKLFLSYGVTTVRTMDGRPYILDWKKKVKEGELIGPDIYTAGQILEGSRPYWNDTRSVKSVSEAKDAVLNQHRSGYDFIKIYHTLSEKKLVNAIIKKASELNIPVTGHAPIGIAMEEFLKSNISSIEHFSGYDELIESDISPFKNSYHWSKQYLAMPADSIKKIRAAQLTSEQGVWNCPTLVQQNKIAPYDSLEKWYDETELGFLPYHLREQWNPENIDPDFKRLLQSVGNEEMEILHQGQNQRYDLTRLFQQFGAELLIGTDTPNPFVMPGKSVHDEIENFFNAGLNLHEVLNIATNQAGKYIAGNLDLTSKLGKIKEGFEADMLLLDKNPIENISNTSTIAGVMANGKWYNREKLDEFRKEVKVHYQK